jgi:hypothetical protein
VEVDRPDRRRRPVRRFPQRTTDRVEDAAAWLLMVLALITVVGAAAIGVAGWSDAMDRVRAEAADRSQVRAVLVEAATSVGVHQVVATWTGRDGVAVTGPVPVRDRRPAGAEVRVWLDGAGRVTSAPVEPGAAVAVGWVRGVLAALCGWSLLALAWAGVRRVVELRNAAAWGRQWARVEPTWSGRAQP